jgi:hypothetical protein
MVERNRLSCGDKGQTPRPPEASPVALAPELARGTGPIELDDGVPVPVACEEVPNRLYRRLVVALSVLSNEQKARLHRLIIDVEATPSTLAAREVREIESQLRGLVDGHHVPYERALTHAKLDAVLADLA